MMVLNKNKSTDIKGIKPMYPFSSHFLNVSGFQYHYVDEGSGEAIVMLHGNPTWSFYFRELIKGLSGEYRTIAPDHLGCGLSEKPSEKQYDYRLKNRIQDFESFLNQLRLTKKLTLVLHDWGGMVGMAYAIKYPEHIKRIVIMNTAAFLPPTGKTIPFRLQMIRNLRPFAGPAVLGLNLFARAAIYMAPYKKLSKEVKQGLLAPYNSWRNRIATLKFVQDIPLTERDPSYDIVRHVETHLNLLRHIPMLILWGVHDFVFDMDYLDQWQKYFPKATIHTFKDAGHYLIEDVPEKILSRIKKFLKQYPLED